MRRPAADVAGQTFRKGLGAGSGRIYGDFLPERRARVDPANPQWPDRDRFVRSKGHACPVWYSALAERGYFDKKHLATLRRLGSMLQGHPDMHKCPGIDMSAGSLGQGISAGLGMALAGKLMKKDHSTIVHGVNKVRQKLLDDMSKMADDGNAFLVNYPDQSVTHTDLSAA